MVDLSLVALTQDSPFLCILFKVIILKMKKHRIYRCFILPVAGLEPARGCPQQILSLPRLPFRHAGIYSFSEQMIYYHTPKKFATKKSKKSQKPVPSISQLQLQKLPKIVAGFLPMLYNKYTPISELCSLE